MPASQKNNLCTPTASSFQGQMDSYNPRLCSTRGHIKILSCISGMCCQHWRICSSAFNCNNPWNATSVTQAHSSKDSFDWGCLSELLVFQTTFSHWSATGWQTQPYWEVPHPSSPQEQAGKHGSHLSVLLPDWAVAEQLQRSTPILGFPLCLAFFTES